MITLLIIENFKEHKTLLSNIFLFGDLVLDTVIMYRYKRQGKTQIQRRFAGDN